MNPERPIPQYNLSFEHESEEGREFYIFNHVAVVIRTDGKNYQALPEIMFGTFKDSIYNREDILAQPEEPIDGVDMAYISACLKKAAEVTGMHEFWFHPYDKEGPEKEAARARLFKRYFDITPDSESGGYIVRL